MSLIKSPVVKVICDSVVVRNGEQSRLTTLQLSYPRIIHSEIMTHRVFSRNASSSRAIPIAKIIDQVRNTPAAPYIWTTNKPGMQGEPVTSRMLISKYDLAWAKAANSAADNAEILMAEGLHKQVVNRIMEPYQLMHTIVTATEWDNFFSLRCHPDADPTIEALANEMRKVMGESKPVLLNQGQWHLPYITSAEKATLPVERLLKISAARCARVSYLNHDGSNPDIEKDLALYERLVGSKPIHASPVEHQACGIDAFANAHMGLGGNFSSLWVQYRKIVECKEKLNSNTNFSF